MTKEHLARRLKDLRRRFSNNANVLQTADGAACVPGKSLHPHWIVGRGLCIYRCESFANVPKNRRRIALHLKIPLWSPFERTGHYACWRDSTAMVWLWDAAIVDEQPSKAVEPQRQWRFVPEPLFLPRKPDGTYLQPCAHGFELQVWRDDVVQESFWFADPPDDTVVTRVLGSAGTNVHQVPSSPRTAEPWPTPVAPVEWLQANERTLVASVLLALALAVVGLETRVWTVYAETAGAADRVATLEGDLGPILSDRTAFLDTRRRNAGMADLLAYPSQAALISLVDAAIPGDTATFYRWTYEYGELTVVVEDSGISPLDYVESLQREPRFEQVRVQLVGGDRLEISLRVKAP